MKKILLFIFMLYFCNISIGQTTLAPGDIVITGFNADDPDQFTFVLLKDVVNGTVIKFTDNGWETTNNFRNNEGTLIWTATSDLSCGTEITVIDNQPFTVSSGAITDAALFLLNANGDQILAYQGAEATPVFIYAIHFNGTVWSTTVNNPNQSAIPSGLTNGVNAVAVGDVSNANYNCSGGVSGQSHILAGVSNLTNWTNSNAPIPIGGCSYTCDQCTGTTTTWNGMTNGWDNGTPTSVDKVILNGDFTTTSGVNLLGCTLTVNAGYTLTVADNTFVEIQNEVIVDGTIAVNPYGSFVQRNDALGASGTTINTGGLVQVFKETAPTVAWYEYTYLSAPVQNETIDALVETEPSRRFIFQGQNFLDHCAETANNNALVCDDGFGNGVQDGIDDNNDDWAWIPGSTTMLPGVGYVTTLTQAVFNATPGSAKQIILSPFEGPFNNGIINVPVYRNDSELNDENVNLIGNPYPSAIDADLFLAENMFNASTNTSGALEGVIYLWSQNTAPSAIANGNQQLNFSDSDYAIINGAGTMAGGDGFNPTNRKIPSGQAFFVNYANTAPANLVSGSIFTTNVTFNNSMRTIGETDNSLFFKDQNSKKQSNSTDNKLWINLTSDTGIFNQMVVAYVNGATNGNDGTFYDAAKASTTVTGAILYSNIEGSNKKFGIQAKATGSLNLNETISLGFKSNMGTATLYKLSIDHLQGDFLNNNTIYLKDNLLNKLHNLSAADYTFVTEVGEFNNRFEIVFNTATLSTDEALLSTNKFSIVNLDNNNIQFNTNSNLSIKSIQIFDLLGRQWHALKGQSNSETINLPNLKFAVYIAKIELSNGEVFTRKAIRN